MTILHVRSSNFYGGPERQLHRHAQAMTPGKYRLVVGSFAENGRRPELLNRMAADGLDTILFEVTGAYDRSAIGRIRRYLAENEVALLCSHDYRAHILGHLACYRQPVKHVCFSRGFTRDDFKVRCYQYIDRKTLRFADHIVAVSGSEKSKLLRLHIPEPKISVAYNSVDPEEFEAIEPVDLRGRYNLARDAFICVTGGRFSLEKGQRFLIDAAMKALEKNSRLRFVMFGDGPDWQGLKEKVDDSRWSSHILLSGFENNLIGCLKGADLLINPSMSEGMPNIVLESMAVGTPVLATAVGGVPEIISDGENGCLVPFGEIPAMSEALLRLADQPDLGKDFAQRARQTVRDGFSFEKQADALREIYDRVLK